MPKSLDLNVDSPDKVLTVLRNAVKAYYESAEELSAAWQDKKQAGKPWVQIVRILDQTISKIDRLNLS